MMNPNNDRIIIDLGNTLSKVAIFRSNEMLSLDAFERGSEEKLLHHLMLLPTGSFCIVSSVVDYSDEVRHLLETRFKTVVPGSQTLLPIIIKYETPETLGKDRIAAAVAAREMVKGSHLLVIDAGTAITMDFINKEGEFIGGAISPGIDLRFKSLHTFTSHLPLIQKEDIDYLTGTTTKESIQSGVVNGVVCEIDGIIDKYKLLYPDLKVVFGGGDNNFLAKRLKNSIFAVPNLVLKGLNIILAYNIENKELA